MFEYILLWYFGWTKQEGLCCFKIQECNLSDFISVLFTASYEFYCVFLITKFLNTPYFKEKILWLYLVDLLWLGMCLLGLVVRPISYSVYCKICSSLSLAALNLDAQP